jgi:hypothetical protein
MALRDELKEMHAQQPYWSDGSLDDDVAAAEVI